MSIDENAPVLTDRRGLGGVIAQDGFDYQIWDALTRVPGWLGNPSFEQVIFEGLEDVEARFFAPHAPPHHHVLERFQAKNASLAPGDVLEVLRNFQTYEKKFPQTTRVHTLVTPRMPATLQWLSRDPTRVRSARPFYAPFADIMGASDAKLLSDLAKTYDEELAGFIANAVDFAEVNITDRDGAAQAFAIELERAFPHLEISRKSAARSFDAVETLARERLGAPISRVRFIKKIEEALEKSLNLPFAYPIHVRSDRNGANETALEIDASMFSGGPEGYPDPDEWEARLLKPLDLTARWLRSEGISRVALSGSYRLSMAMVLGWSLRSATGFELEIPTRGGAWMSDARPAPYDAPPAWQFTGPEKLHEDHLVVSIGIIRNPAADLTASAGVPADCVLSCFLPPAVTSELDAQASVMLLRRTVEEAVARMRPTGIRLYFAGPAAFAVALGHRWNALPRTQLYEFDPANRQYSPTARIG